MHPIVEGFWRIFFTIIFKWIYKVKIIHEERAPKEGAYIIAPNHASNFDPPLAGLAMPRPTYYMAKEELFRNPIVRFFVKSLGAFPVRRGKSDAVAIRRALEILGNGELLGMFPQGTRRKEGVFKRLHDGVAILAMKTGTPIIPLALVGTSKLRRGKVAVVVGEPIMVTKEKPNKEKIDEIKEELSTRLELLYKEGKAELE